MIKLGLMGSGNISKGHLRCCYGGEAFSDWISGFEYDCVRHF